ncbi:unnamed protein product, partial [Durusdinium trenchii]
MTTGSEVRTRRRAALCLTGHLRSATFDPNGLFVEPLQRVVLRSLSNSGYVVDVFAVTDAGEDCRQADEMLEPLRLKALHCIPQNEEDDLQRRKEDRWLKHGARTVWSRTAFLGQLKKVQACGELIGEQSYDLVARSRLDVRWYSFPADARVLEVPGVVWLPFRATESMTQYMNDLFAIGSQDEMKPYLRVYEELLDRGNWKLHRSFESSPDGLDTEELWQVSLLKAGILARQHPEICFNLLSRNSSGTLPLEREDNCRDAQRHPHGYFINTEWSKAPLSTLPGIFPFDSLLTVRLLHFFYAEYARLGRPAKVLDLGCGRGSMIERWLGYHPASIACIDMLPGLREILGHDLVELDLTQHLDPRSFMTTRSCSLIGGTQSLERLLSAAEFHHMTRAETFKSLLNCCYTPGCLGFFLSPVLDEDRGLILVFNASQSWDAEHMVWLARRNFSKPNKLAWARAADWDTWHLGQFRAECASVSFNKAPSRTIEESENASRTDEPWLTSVQIRPRSPKALLLDVAHYVPRNRWPVLVDNVDRLAAQGLIVTSPFPVLAKLQQLLAKHSFVRDRQTEDLLQPYAMIRGLREDQLLQVYRRDTGRFSASFAFPPPFPCTLTLESEVFEGRCILGITMGCSDEEYIWVNDACYGWFRRGQSQGACISDAGSVQRSRWAYNEVKSQQFVECYLPEVRETLEENVRTLGPDASEVMHFCKDTYAQDPLPLHFSDGAWHTEEFVCEHVMMAIQLPFDAIVEVSGYSELLRGSGWPNTFVQRAGECKSWNLIPLFGLAFSFDVWKISTPEGFKKLEEVRRTGGRESLGNRGRLPLPWLVADLQVRASSNTSGSAGILGLYDYLDAASHWSNRSRIWQDAGGELDNHAESLQRVDGQAALLLVLRITVAKMLRQKVPATMLNAAESLISMSAGAMMNYARQLLTQDASIDNITLAEGENSPVEVRDTAEGPRLHFSNVPLGRYLHHTATFA